MLKQYCFDTFSSCESNFLHVESKHPKNVQKKVQKKATKLVKNGSQQEFKKGPTQTLRWRQLVIKSASRELIQDSGNRVEKKRFFRLWAAGVSRVARKRSGSMTMLTGTRTHAAAVPPTLP